VATPEEGKLAIILDTALVVTDEVPADVSDTYYSGVPVVASDPAITATQFQVDFDRTANLPPTGDYTILMAVRLEYNNNGDIVVMDAAEYTFTVNVAGSESSAVYNSGSGSSVTGGYTNADVAETETASGTVVSAPPASLDVGHTSGGANLQDDIVLTAQITGDDIADFTLWLETGDQVRMDSSVLFTTDPYVWPAAAMVIEAGKDAEVSGTSSVTLTLKSVPVYLYNSGTVFVEMTVHYRDESNDLGARRALRALQGTGGVPLEEGSANMVAQVTFGSDGSGATIITSFMVVSATALSGAALFL
jgi:hypothetical protein